MSGRLVLRQKRGRKRDAIQNKCGPGNKTHQVLPYASLPTREPARRTSRLVARNLSWSSNGRQRETDSEATRGSCCGKNHAGRRQAGMETATPSATAAASASSEAVNGILAAIR